MKIVIKTLKGEQFPLDVEPSDTVLSVKEKIQKEKDFDVESQKLLHKGKIKSNEATLEESGIKDSDYLIVTIIKKKPEAPKKAEQQQEKKEESNKMEEEPQQAKKQEEQQQQGEKKEENQSQQKQPQQQQGHPFGAELEKNIDEIISMGVGDGDREKIKKALIAAFNDPNTAVEFLLSGNIPDVGGQMPQDMGGEGEMDEGELQEALKQQFNAICQTPQFQQIRQAIQQNPQASQQILQQVMQMIQQNDPQLFALISQNPNIFLQALQGGQQQGGEGAQQQQNDGHLYVTPQEKDAIERIMGFGFEKTDVVEAYFSCDKDENLTLNFLLEQQSSGQLGSQFYSQQEEAQAIQQSMQSQGQQQQQQQSQQQNQQQNTENKDENKIESENKDNQQQQGQSENKDENENKNNDDKKNDNNNNNNNGGNDKNGGDEGSIFD